MLVEGRSRHHPRIAGFIGIQNANEGVGGARTQTFKQASEGETMCVEEPGFPKGTGEVCNYSSGF